MSRNGPFEAYRDLVTDPKIMALHLRMHDEKIMLNKLKHLRVKSIDKAPDWDDCVHIQFEPDSYNRNLMLEMFASKLAYNRKNPVEIAKSANCIWVRTE